MATWKPAPSVPNQAAGADGPLSGKFPYGETIGTTAFQPPTPPWKPAPRGDSFNNATQGIPL